MTSAQVLLTFFDMSARTHYLNARQTLRKLLEWRVVPVINENDTTTTDEISFGDNDFLAAQVAILLGADLLVLLTDTDGLFTADPRRTRGAARRGGDRLRGARRARDRPRDLAAGLGRDALEGRGRRDGHGGGDPGRDLQRAARGRAGRRGGGRARGHALPAPGGALLVVQAVAEVRQAEPRDGGGRRRRGAGAARGRARACCRSASSTSGASSTRATPSRSPTARRAIGKGICNYSAAELRRVKGLKSAQVRELLPRATEEAVHRDYFVLA